MRHAFTLLGVMVLIVSIGAFLTLNRAHAPSGEENKLSPQDTSMKLTLTSPAFEQGGMIPSKDTCDGKNVSPELRVSGVPEGTKSLVLVMDDPDIPESVKQSRKIEKFDHWTLYALPPDTTVIPEGAAQGSLGLTSAGKAAYAGPCPPDREHRYFFRLYALSGTLNFITVPTQRDVEEAAKGMMIESATLMGRYEKVKTKN